MYEPAFGLKKGVLLSILISVTTLLYEKIDTTRDLEANARFAGENGSHDMYSGSPVPTKHSHNSTLYVHMPHVVQIFRRLTVPPYPKSVVCQTHDPDSRLALVSVSVVYLPMSLKQRSDHPKSPVPGSLARS